MAYLIAQSKAFLKLEELLRVEYEELTERFSYWKLYLKRKKSNKKKIIQTIGFDTLIHETIKEKIIFYY